MKKSELRELVREIVGGYEPDGQGNLVRHNDKFDSTKLSSLLKGIVNRGEKPIKEEGEEKTYLVYFKKNEDDQEPEEVQATSEQDAIAKVKAAGGRNTRSFSAKLK